MQRQKSQTNKPGIFGLESILNRNVRFENFGKMMLDQFFDYQLFSVAGFLK
jgi:hypothetical protein